MRDRLGLNGGVSGTLLRDANPGATRGRMLRRFAGAPEAPLVVLEAVITRRSAVRSARPG